MGSNIEMVTNNKSNIILIGMPSSGKTTIGNILSTKLKKNFVDTDNLIKLSQNLELKDIVKEFGQGHFLKVQENEILSLSAENSVIATGGSVIYGNKSMEYLKSIGKIIYLMVSIEELKARIQPDRRLARNTGQSFEHLYYERVPLYEKYSDYTINCSNKTAEDIATVIMQL